MTDVDDEGVCTVGHNGGIEEGNVVYSFGDLFRNKGLQFLVANGIE